MNIIVCVKQIIDPETPAAAFKIDAEAKRAIPPKDMSMVISDYDANAVETALKLKDAHSGKVTVLSLGGESAREVIMRCLAMGADEGVLLNDPAFDDSDSFATASILTEAIKKTGEYDLILCGRQEGDWDAGQVGSGIAELLGIPSVTVVGKIEVSDGKIRVERVVADGREVIEIGFPSLFTISSEVGKPRYATFKGIMSAKKKPITYWSSQDVSPAEARNKMLKLFIPVRKSKCEFIEGETSEEAGTNLAIKIRGAKII
ncbi:Caffeyl-CoA reductase-Etf complex subunit CarD [subsurface metagenome]